MKSLRVVVQALLASSTALAGSGDGRDSDAPCPTAIRQTVPDYTWADWGGGLTRPAFSSMAAIHAALLRCADITTLQVRVTLRGCADWPDRFNFPFDPRGGTRYASAPHVLSLDGYDADQIERDPCEGRSVPSWRERFAFWTQLRTAWQCLDYSPLPEAQRNKTNLDLWLDAMDFSRIQTLQLNYTRGHDTLTEQVVRKLPSRLTSLESLALNGALAEQFILALPNSSLRHLSWQNPGYGDWEHTLNDSNATLSDPLPPLGPVLQHHGSSLLSLEFHTDEWDYRGRPTLSVQELGELVTLAPGLESLTLDLNRQSDGTDAGQRWPWKGLQLLTEALPELTELTIYLELANECHREESRRHPWGFSLTGEPSNCTEHYAQPRLNQTSGIEMARFLWQHKAGQSLRKVSFRAGDWTIPWDGPLKADNWLEGQRVWVDCRMDHPAAAGEGQDTLPGEIVCEAGYDGPFSAWTEDDHISEVGLGWVQ